MCKARFCVFVFAGLVTTLSSIASSKAGELYLWCAEYSGAMGGSNCGFVTFEQCQATVHGAGGFCRKNGFYESAGEKPAKPRRKLNPG
jgi:hypothetical protein